MSQPINRNQKGFTIVELMIATTVLSVILLLVTIMIISIGNLYYKDINVTRVQDTTRAITNGVAQDLQLSNTTATQSSPAPANPGDVGVLCIGDVRYTYVVGEKIGTNGWDHVIWRDNFSGCDPTVAANLKLANPDDGSYPGSGTAGSGAELISPNSWLPYFSVTGTSPYTVKVVVAYGDPSQTTNSGTPDTTICNGAAGDQFCATGNLTTTVLRRISSGGH